MKTFVSLGDFGDFSRKFSLKGRNILKRVFLPSHKKVSGTWDQTILPRSNWWDIPSVRKRWNYLITGDENINYPEFVHQKFLQNRTNLRMASPGCGTGSHERLFHHFDEIESIIAFDISTKSIEKAKEEYFPKINYQVSDFYAWLKEPERFDLLFFYSSLHHFKNLDKIIPALKSKLNPDGIIIIHEYVGPDRMMWTPQQMKEVNRLLKSLPPEYRHRFGSKSIKKKVFRPGLLRTLLSDPSESIESSQIRPELQKHFTPLYEKGFGGNLLHLLFKDIAQNFITDKIENHQIIQQLFDAEDKFLLKYPSDFHFGIYQVPLKENGNAST